MPCTLPKCSLGRIMPIRVLVSSASAVALLGIITLGMLSSRPFRVLVTVLIAVGMHICCCQLSLFGMRHGSHVSDSKPLQCCDHHHNQNDENPEQAPDTPHHCCGAHANVLTSQSVPLELPTFTLIELPPVLALERPNCGVVAFPPFADGCPALQTALVKRHCALTI